MKSLVDFFINIGQLRKLPRRGDVLIGAKDPASITDHLFRVAVMSWILGREKKANLNLRKVLTMALAHDLFEFHVGDMSPYDYDSLLPKNKNKWPELFDKWPRFSKSEKRKMTAGKHKREEKGINKLIKDLPKDLGKEVKDAWVEYEGGLTKEARFVKQINRLETLLQALEHGREMKAHVYNSWWIGTKERIDDPILLKFMDQLSKEFSTKKSKK